MAPYEAPWAVRRFPVGALPKGIGEIHLYDIVNLIFPALLGIRGLSGKHNHKEKSGYGEVLISHGPEKIGEALALDLRSRVVDSAHRTGEILYLVAVRIYKVDFLV